jgi:hypothetical protein
MAKVTATEVAKQHEEYKFKLSLAFHDLNHKKQLALDLNDPLDKRFSEMNRKV